MFKPRKPDGIIGLFTIGCTTIILGYFLSEKIMGKEDYFYGFLGMTIFGALFILSAINMNSKHRRKIAMIDSLLISGDTMEAVIVNSRAISGGKNNPPQGYEYLCKGFEGDKIYGSEMIKEDLYQHGQRVTIYKDRSDADRYWVDLDSVKDKNKKSETILYAYNQNKGEGILNEIFHKFDDKKNGKIIMTIWLGVMGIIIAGIPYILIMQFLFYISNTDQIGFSFWHIALLIIALIPYGYIIYKLYTKVSLAFGKAFFDGLQKVLIEMKNTKD